MNKQELKNLRIKPLTDLEKMVRESRERLRHLQLDLAAGKVKNVGELRELRKDIARIETVMSDHRRSVPAQAQSHVHEKH